MSLATKSLLRIKNWTTPIHWFGCSQTRAELTPEVTNVFLFFSVLNTDGRVVDQARAWCQSMGVAFFRMSPLLSVDVELDEKDDKVLVDMMWNAMAYIHSKKDDVIQLKAFLLCD